ncbi:MAG: 5'(3')-deoxyribonucleotidase [Verrucomicrobia bacterium]|nr:5'(3')-deoxyribonucleotidase [Cytophagales bacterium]
MQRIAIDMDDVLADTTGRFIEYAYTRLGKKIKPVDLHGKNWAEVTEYEHVRNWLFEDNFFRNIKVMADSQDVMKKLCEKYEVFIVSAATEFPNSLKEKIDWLDEFFPFISWKYIVFCGHKYMIQADYLIDDHERNLVSFTGKPILFSAPHNIHLQAFTRVNNWQEIASMFL